MSKRRKLNFADTDAIVAEVRRLRGGYSKLGSWSLPQVCWHMKTVIGFSMRPPPHDRVKTNPIRRLILRLILWSGRIPGGRKGPDRANPPMDAPDSAIEEFVEVLAKLKSFAGPFAPNPIFGQMNLRDYERFHRIHSAHHLGYLLPAKS